MNKLYRLQRSPTGTSLVPKLKFEHIALTSFSKMRVDLAAQVSTWLLATVGAHKHPRFGAYKLLATVCKKILTKFDELV